MANLTLQQIFGANAHQDINYLVVIKNDFLSLTSTPTNKAESLLVAIVLNLHSNFEGVVLDENNLPVTDELDNNITFSNLNLYELLNVFHWKRQFLQTMIVDTFVVESNEI